MIEEVVEKIFWTDNAKATFNNIVEYLRQEWTEREVEQLVNRTEKMLATLKRYPEMCRPSAKRKNIRIGVLDKHTQLVYHYKPRKKQIEILLFWGMRQNPSNFNY
ncbi:MAG: type II toxin-antitoxin system RelE/ParE family toxin [Chitinophagaceae bacterium]|jgi:plasmid stabilization system protein ParE|nr:type II toxin-antitoxin system RelE/ParE family toxin [Chitinophagaceae bacterium]